MTSISAINARTEWLANPLNPHSKITTETSADSAITAKNNNNHTMNNMQQLMMTSSDTLAPAADSEQTPSAAGSRHMLPDSSKPMADVTTPIPPYGVLVKKVRSKNSRVGVRISLDKDTYVAGEMITGRVEIQCSNERAVKLGDIVVYVSAYEAPGIFLTEITTKPIQRRLFLSKSIDLQNIHLAPSDAVVAGIPDEHGMWNARRGLTFFDFSVRLDSLIETSDGRQVSIPSSYWSRKAGGIRYIISATVKTKLGFKEPTILADHRETQVIELNPFALLSSFVRNPALTGDGSSLVGWLPSRKGEVKVHAECHVQGSMHDHADSDIWIAGTVGYVAIEIFNASRRSVKTIRLSLIRRLKTFSTITPPDEINVHSNHRLENSTSTTTFQDPTLTPIHFSRLTVSERVYKATSRSKYTSLAVMNASKAGDGWTEEDGLIRCSKENMWWSGVRPGERRRLMTEIYVPSNARTIRNGVSIEVSYIVQVSVVPDRSTPITIEIPITILHSASLMMNQPVLSRFGNYLTTRNASIMDKEKAAKANGNKDILMSMRKDGTLVDDMDQLSIEPDNLARHYHHGHGQQEFTFLSSDLSRFGAGSPSAQALSRESTIIRPNPMKPYSSNLNVEESISENSSTHYTKPTEVLKSFDRERTVVKKQQSQSKYGSSSIIPTLSNNIQSIPPPPPPMPSFTNLDESDMDRDHKATTTTNMTSGTKLYQPAPPFAAPPASRVHMINARRSTVIHNQGGGQSNQMRSTNTHYQNQIPIINVPASSHQPHHHDHHDSMPTMTLTHDPSSLLPQQANTTADDSNSLWHESLMGDLLVLRNSLTENPTRDRHSGSGIARSLQASHTTGSMYNKSEGIEHDHDHEMGEDDVDEGGNRRGGDGGFINGNDFGSGSEERSSFHASRLQNDGLYDLRDASDVSKTIDQFFKDI
ncbi:hypothetical protein HDU76_004094 [Blyttiomyces sp. JEL0837]|nr:hypothetical protein HDU76_004094 [Blyttiomyces sp. JEL0837]